MHADQMCIRDRCDGFTLKEQNERTTGRLSHFLLSTFLKESCVTYIQIIKVKLILRNAA